MRFLVTVTLACVCIVSPLLHGQKNPPQSSAGLKAVGYYIAVHASLNSDRQVDVFAASNLPQGSILWLQVYDFLGTGSKSITPGEHVILGADGLIRTSIRPKPGLAFRSNMICILSFAPTYPKQPAHVLGVVGKTGEHLGDWKRNPQIDGNDRVSILTAVTVIR